MARPHTINDEITGDQIRLIGEEGEQLGILALTKATAGDEVRVYAVNYNVLRVMSGMGGLAYSN